MPRKPADGTTGVEHRLTAHLYCSRDVGADDVIGALELGRHASIVIRQAQSERRHAVHGQQLRQTNMAARIGIPLRQHENCRASIGG